MRHAASGVWGLGGAIARMAGSYSCCAVQRQSCMDSNPQSRAFSR
jgi:hypothetical protein